jgi:hypothetical protein
VRLTPFASNYLAMIQGACAEQVVGRISFARWYKVPLSRDGTATLWAMTC